LLRQHLGGRHQHCLSPRCDDVEHRSERDHGLARADVALQQPRHRHGPLDVSEHLAEHPSLRARQLEGQRGDEGARGRVLRDGGSGARALPRAAAPHHAELDRQQLVEGEAPARALHRLRVVGVVELPRRLGEGRQRVPLQQRRGQPLRDAIGVALEQRRDQRAQRALREPGGEAVDRHEPPRVAPTLGARRAAEELELRVVEAGPAAIDAHSAGQRDLSALAQLPHHVRLVEPDDADGRARGVRDRRLRGAHAAAAPHPHLANPVEAAAHRLLQTHAQLRDRHRAAEVVVAVGEVAQRVADRDEPEALQPRDRCGPRADARACDRQLERRRGLGDGARRRRCPRAGRGAGGRACSAPAARRGDRATGGMSRAARLPRARTRGRHAGRLLSVTLALHRREGPAQPAAARIRVQRAVALRGESRDHAQQRRARRLVAGLEPQQSVDAAVDEFVAAAARQLAAQHLAELREVGAHGLGAGEPPAAAAAGTPAATAARAADAWPVAVTTASPSTPGPACTPSTGPMRPRVIGASGSSP
jgi:hypothetical protein